MNRIKKTGLGLLVATLAFGFSAFTTGKRTTVLVYYKTNTSYPNANDPRGYTYFSDDMCGPGSGVCSARWDIGSNSTPTDGISLPTVGVTYQSGSSYTGSYNPF